MHHLESGIMKLGLIKDIDNVFASYRQLESLSFEFCQFFPNANFEVVCVSVKKLNLLNCIIYDEHLQNFVKIFPFLEELTISVSSFHPKWNMPTSVNLPPSFVLDCLKKTISRFKNLRKLNVLHMFHNDLTDESLDQLIKLTVKSVMKEAFAFILVNEKKESEILIRVQYDYGNESSITKKYGEKAIMIL